MVIQWTSTIVLFALGGISAWFLSELPSLDAQWKRDTAYIMDAIILSALVILFNAILPLRIHLSSVAVVIGVLGWAVYDDFFSEAHGKFNPRRKTEPGHNDITQHDGAQTRATEVQPPPTMNPKNASMQPVLDPLQSMMPYTSTVPSPNDASMTNGPVPPVDKEQ